MTKDNLHLNETQINSSIDFDSTLGAECDPAKNQKALLVVHFGSVSPTMLLDKYKANYTKYHQQVGDKIQQYLENGDIIIMVTMRQEWQNAPAFLPSKNVVHLVTRNGDSKILQNFDCEDKLYKQNLPSFVELLLAKDVRQIEVIGEFGDACVKGIKNTFDKLDKFKITLGNEVFY